jgi:hypothetical protein
MSAILRALIPDIALSTARVGTVSLLANPQFSIQIFVVVPQFCLRRKTDILFLLIRFPLCSCAVGDRRDHP